MEIDSWWPAVFAVVAWPICVVLIVIAVLLLAPRDQQPEVLRAVAELVRVDARGLVHQARVSLSPVMSNATSGRRGGGSPAGGDARGWRSRLASPSVASGVTFCD
jgi:hypothetical protein